TSQLWFDEGPISPSYSGFSALPACREAAPQLCAVSRRSPGARCDSPREQISTLSQLGMLIIGLDVDPAKQSSGAPGLWSQALLVGSRGGAVRWITAHISRERSPG